MKNLEWARRWFTPVALLGFRTNHESRVLTGYVPKKVLDISYSYVIIKVWEVIRTATHTFSPSYSRIYENSRLVLVTPRIHLLWENFEDWSGLLKT